MEKLSLLYICFIVLVCVFSLSNMSMYFFLLFYFLWFPFPSISSPETVLDVLPTFQSILKKIQRMSISETGFGEEPFEQGTESGNGTLLSSDDGSLGTLGTIHCPQTPYLSTMHCFLARAC